MSAKKPEDRYPDYASLLADVRRVKAGFAPVLRTPGQPIWKSRKVQVGGAVVLAFVIAAAMILSPRSSKKQSEKAAAIPTSSQPPQLERATDERLGGPPAERRGGERFRPGERMRQGDRAGDFQEPGNGNNRRLWPKGPPPEPPPALDDGPPARMMKEADKFAAENKGEYIRIEQTYRQVEERAFGTPIQQEVSKKLDELEKEHGRVASAAIKEYEHKFLAKLHEGKVEDAYNLWMDFPKGLRNREIDQQIRQIMENNLPADFDPGP
jgi:hypothetical protein